jgi:putative inorganic carbon (HCO3(-)) transporter
MPFFLLISFLFMMYANPAVFFPPLEAVRPVQLAGVAALAMLTVRKTIWGETWRFVRPEGLYMAALLIAGGLSCLGAFWPRLAFESAMDLAKVGLIYYAIVNLVDTELRLKRVTLVLVAAGIVPAFFTLKNYAAGNFVEGTRAAWVGTFGNPNDVAYSLVMLVPIAFQVRQITRWFYRPLIWGVIAVYFAGIFVTQSRGGLLGAGAVLLILGLRQEGIGARILTIAALIGILVFGAFYWGRDAGFENLQTDFTAYQRIETIKAGLRMFADNPFLGVGLGCSIVAWSFYAPTNLAFKDTLVIHNTPVQALSEIGLLGFIPFMLLMGAAWVHVRRMARSPSPLIRQCAVAFEASLAGFVVCGLFGGYLLSWYPYIVIGLISALTCLNTEGDADAVHP